STLTSLTIPSNTCGASEIRKLQAASFYEHLTNLQLEGWKLRDTGLVKLVTQLPPHLEVLNISATNIGADDLKSFSGIVAPQLSEFYLNETAPGAKSIAALLSSDSIPKLRCLHLEDVRLGGTGIKKLANLPQLAQLRELNLTRTGLQASGLQTLLASEYLENLHNLSIGDYRFGKEEVDVLASASLLDGLVSLALPGLKMTEEIATTL